MPNAVGKRMRSGTGAAFAATLMLVASHCPTAAEGPLPPLQALIDATPVGAVLRPPAGRYAGPVRIGRFIHIDGGGQVEVDGGGEGTVMQIDASGVTLEGLIIRNSGKLHDHVDAGIKVRGKHNVIKNNRIIDCLFGIDLQRSDGNTIKNNFITSQNISIGLRGDAIRLWYSMNNAVLDNHISDARDTVVWYSNDNRIAGNLYERGRYGVHFMYSRDSIVENNRFDANTVGVFLMYADRVQVRNNRITYSQGPAGIGIGLKESSEIALIDNDIMANAWGLYLDVSPYEPDVVNTIKNNRVAFNGIGVVFHNDWQGNNFEHNSFVSNFTPVAVRGGGSAMRERFDGNYWEGYEGFDLDDDGIGDTAHRLFAWSDRLWMDVPDAQVFRASVSLELLDFAEKLAPLTDPRLILVDERPLTRPPVLTRAARCGNGAGHAC